MEIRKDGGIGAGAAVDEQSLALINAQSPKALTAEEVFTFSVRLCDNEIDRDNERFPRESLEELAEKFVGKTGIFDHEWSAKGQAARIFRTELCQEAGVTTAAGDAYCFLKGDAYMLRTAGNRDLIAEIAGGIKKEVSVGCAVTRAVCSVCGEEMGLDSQCSHAKGRSYSGKRCWAELLGVTDAYEWSFVAVPSQRKAGVIKQFGEVRTMDLKKMAQGQAECLAELEQLEADAALGRKYLQALRGEVVRLGALAQDGLDAETRKSIAEKLGEAELAQMKKSYAARAAEQYPVGVQLTYRGGGEAGEEKDGAFLI